MADRSTPRVKLPDVMPHKPVIPGPNSWAQSAAQGQAFKEGQSTIPNVTNRAKYEAKPMPATPTSLASEQALAIQKHRRNVQPATPLVLANYESQNHKIRAATDPVAHKSTTKKISIKGLRAKFTNDQATNADVAPEVQPKLPPLPLPSEKASHVLGYYPVPKEKNTKITAPPASAPPTTDTPDPFRSSSDDPTSRSASPVRQAKSTPVPGRPTRRWMRENNMTTPPLETAEPVVFGQEEQKLPPHSGTSKANAMILGDGRLSPTKKGTYGRVAEVEVVERGERITSQHGLVENVSTGPETGTNDYSEYGQEQRPLSDDSIVSNPYAGQTPNSTAILQPAVYSPSVYNGVWENDPNVGYSLPAFSPLQPPPRVPPNPDTEMRGHPSQSSGITIPMVFQGHASEITPVSMYAPSFRSINSWASGSNANLGNSYAQPNIPESATVPPLFAQGSRNNNFVPPPPRSYGDFQPSSAPIPPGLLHLENSLHYHIDVCFERLTRLVTAKHDRVMDEVIRRCEALEEHVQKGLVGLQEGELTEIKNELSKVKGNCRISDKASNDLKKMIKGVEAGLAKLEKKVEENACKCQDSLAHDTSSSHSAATVTRSSESHRGVGNSQPPSTRHHRSGNSASHATNVGRQSTNSNGGRRSNTMSEGVSGRGSDDRGGLREYFAELGRAIGPEPELAQHPAYVGMQQQHRGHGTGSEPMGMSGSDSVFYQTPQYSGGAWYNQVYGRTE